MQESIFSLVFINFRFLVWSIFDFVDLVKSVNSVDFRRFSSIFVDFRQSSRSSQFGLIGQFCELRRIFQFSTFNLIHFRFLVWSIFDFVYLIQSVNFVDFVRFCRCFPSIGSQMPKLLYTYRRDGWPLSQFSDIFQIRGRFTLASAARRFLLFA